MGEQEPYSLDRIFFQQNNLGMAWEIEVSDEFRRWYERLTDDEQDSITFGAELLAAKGPALGRPYVDTVKASRYPT